MPQRLDGDVEQDLLEQQQQLRDEVQRLRDEQQRLRDVQEKQREAGKQDAKPEDSQKGDSQEGVSQQGAAPAGASQSGDPKEEAKKGDAKPEQGKEPAKKRKLSPVAIVVILVVVVALAIGGFFLWGYLSSYESTDDAEIDGHIDSVSSRINGTVTVVHVDDNYNVKSGETLVELDPRDYQVALEQAQADLRSAEAQLNAQNPNVPLTSTSNQTNVATTGLDVSAAQASLASTEAMVGGAEQDYTSALANVRLAQANHNNDVAEVARYKALVDKDEVSREQYEAKVTQAKASEATVQANQAIADSKKQQIDQARAQVLSSRAQVNSTKAKEEQARQNAPRQIAIQRASVANRQAEVMSKRADVDQAILNLQYTKIFAPATGIVGKKKVEVGTRVSPGQELLAVIPLDDIWITANFKETQLKKMREGQRVTVKVDAFGREYEGKVESIAAASGARYSLLPPENATGNYVKVVQRIPVRLRLNSGQNDDRRLRPGMSVEPKVWLQ